MNSAEQLVEAIMAEIPKHFPIAAALKDQPLQFAAGVDVRDVVEMVSGMALMHVLEKMRQEGIAELQVGEE